MPSKPARCGCGTDLCARTLLLGLAELGLYHPSPPFHLPKLCQSPTQFHSKNASSLCPLHLSEPGEKLHLTLQKNLAMKEGQRFGVPGAGWAITHHLLNCILKAVG